MPSVPSASLPGVIGHPLSHEQYKQARVALDRARRQRLAAQGDRKIVGAGREAKLTQEALDAARRSLDDGVPLARIAEVLWRRHGFASKKACVESLRRRLVC